MLIITAVVVVLILAILGLAATKPNSMQVQRTAAINAPAASIFPLINDFHKWPQWSPYEKLDPAMKKTVSGAPAGPGAVYEWSGNNKAGAGRMEITDTTPPSKIMVKLDFTRPFRTHNVVVFTLEPRGDSTNVTWAMDAPSPFMTKVMGVVINMDNLIGRDFATGLANLKAIAER